jgi:peptidoglycan/xylan/chitin deacetylase (PgdA/CDA1 family)
MEKTIYLTFDDGPNEPYTSQILDILKTFGTKAAFFVCGQNIERHPESLKKIFNEGHAIGNHSYSHNMSKVLLGGQALKEEIIKTNRLIKQYAGIDSILYRSPWGLTMPWLRPWLKANNFNVYHWDIMAYDWRQPPADWMADYIVSKVNIKIAPDPIILLHDGNQTMGGDRSQTVKALPVILESLLKQNYKFQSLDNI